MAVEKPPIFYYISPTSMGFLIGLIRVDAKRTFLKSTGLYLLIFQDKPGRGKLNTFKNMFEKGSKIRKKVENDISDRYCHHRSDNYILLLIIDTKKIRPGCFSIPPDKGVL